VTITPVTLTPGWYEVDGVSNVQNFTWDDQGFATDPAITYNANSDLAETDSTLSASRVDWQCWLVLQAVRRGRGHWNV